MKNQLSNIKALTALLFLGLIVQANSSNAQTLNDAPKWIIDNIICEGNTSTKCGFITKKYYQQIGDVLDPEKIADAKLRLGTLIQFKTVNTRLTKGNQRGHVVVVFEVSEADHIQYELGLGYNYASVNMDEVFCQPTWRSTTCATQNGHSAGPAYSAAVTDFNFFGTGKRLSFSISGTNWGNRFDFDETRYNDDGTITHYSEFETTDKGGHTISLAYYDPHLFDSSHYFFAAKLNSRNDDLRSNNRLQADLQQRFTTQGPNQSNEAPVHLEFGRRFGSYSYVSVDLNGHYYSSDNTSSFGINYGWDSQDNSLFPTQGSLFSSTFRKSGRFGHSYAKTDYKQHFAFADNNIVTLGVSAAYAPEEGYRIYGSQWIGHLSARFTSINTISRVQGSYSGWFTELKLGAARHTTYSPGNYSYGLIAGYNYQTDSMIYRFTLGFNHQERN